MIYAEPGQTFTATLEGAAGASVITVRIERTDGTTFMEPTSDGIIDLESGAGVYAKADFVAPTVKGTYVLIWDVDGSAASEELRVLRDVVAVGAVVGPEYATAADLRSYMNTTVEALPDEEADRQLARAELYVDEAAGVWAAAGVNGRLFLPTDLTTVQSLGLKAATCAQAEYQLFKGDPFFIEAQLPQQGKDFSSTEREPRIGPKCKETLRRAGLLRRTARMR